MLRSVENVFNRNSIKLSLFFQAESACSSDLIFSTFLCSVSEMAKQITKEAVFCVELVLEV